MSVMTGATGTQSQQHAVKQQHADDDTNKNGSTSTIKLRGTIVRRRSLGRCLAFCDIVCLDPPAPQEDSHDVENGSAALMLSPKQDDDRIRKLVFRKHLVQGDNFPTKKAMLPYGAQLAASCLPPSTSDLKDPQQQPRMSSSSCLLWEVAAWELTNSPHKVAVARASIENGRGISCTDYLRSRREAYDRAVAAAFDFGEGQQNANSKPELKRTKRLTEPAEMMEMPMNDSHGNRRAKALRAKVFAAWIVEHLLRPNNNISATSSSSATIQQLQHDRILDVAGGKGLLALELACLLAEDNVLCTTLDPVQRRRQPTAGHKCMVAPHFVTGSFVNYYPANKQGSLLIQNQNENAEKFAGTSGARQFTRRLVEQHTVLVGLHPDQCTEDILDVALASSHIRAVAIVPCCVYPDLFAMRRLRSSNQVVRSYEQFLQYLLEKDPRLRQTRLPFDGKNECIYLRKSE